MEYSVLKHAKEEKSNGGGILRLAAIGGVVFDIRNCVFPAAGLYWVEVLFSGQVIARKRLIIRA